MSSTSSASPVNEAADGPRILVSGWAGAGNVGDELLTRAVVARLSHLGAHPVVASRDPAQTARLHEVDSVPWGPRGRAAVAQVDGICVGPGGILQDSSSLWSLPGHLVAPLTARRRGLPVAAIGVGAEPLRRRSSARLLRRALRGCPVVTRDEASTEALAAAGLEPTTGADVVFGLDLPPAAPEDEIVVSVGGRVRPGLMTRASRRIEAAPVEEIAAALDRLAERLGARLVLTSFRGERDAATAAALLPLLAARAEVLEPDVDEHVRRVCEARLVISSRYHPIVLAARAGVPSFTVSDQMKVRSLVDQVGSASARRFDSWADLGAATPGPRSDTGIVIGGVEQAHDALAALVDAASASRSQRSGG